jgi:hypothetical protein
MPLPPAEKERFVIDRDHDRSHETPECPDSGIPAGSVPVDEPATAPWPATAAPA